MKSTRRWVTAIVLVSAFVVVIVAALWGVNQTKDNVAVITESQRDEVCASLPSRDVVETFYNAHADEMTAIKAVAAGTRTRVEIPCDGEDRARITIYVTSQEAKQGVEDVIAQQPFGEVPYEIKVLD